MPTPKLFLLDGMALAYRAHFAFVNSNLKNAEGLPTGPIYGFANTLDQLIAQEAPTHIAVAWDTSAPTFRHEMDEQYKAHRPPQPEDLSIGIPLIKEMIEAFGIQNLEKDGYEADDIIGTLAVRAAKAEVETYLVTPDKDFMQLVTDHVKLYKPNNGAKGFDVVGIEGVVEYFGVTPDKVVDVLTLIGDTSDNIPGVPGIGKKGAPALINEYGSIEALLEHAQGIKQNRVRTGLIEFAERARLSKKMVTIMTDVPDTPHWETFAFSGPTSKLGAFFQRMQFRTLAKKYSGGQTSPVKADSGQQDLFGSAEQVEQTVNSAYQRFDALTVQYETITNEADLIRWVNLLHAKEVICFDTETTGKDPISSSLIGLSFSVESGKACYIPVEGESCLSKSLVIEHIRPLFEDQQRLIVAQNLKFDYIVLRKEGIRIRGKVFDTMLAAYLIDSSQSVGMDALSMKYLNYEPISIESLIGKGKAQRSMLSVPLNELSVYACEDADITFRLYEVLSNQIKKDELSKVAEEIEFPLSLVLAEMELHGILIDKSMLKVFSAQLAQEMKALEKEIYEMAGESFNLNSPQQMAEILFVKLQLPSGKKTATGKYSTGEDVLSKLALKYELPAKILEYRALAKLSSTYVDALPELIHPETGRVHTSFNQSVAATGRLSSSNPNLQNIPIRTARGREIRKAFIVPEGHKMISADYSQIELRVIAAISGDEPMKRAFEQNEDIHARTAKEIFHLNALEEVTPDQRRKAKEVNFGIPYGVSAYGLASRLDIGNDEGKAMIEAYFANFPAVQGFMEKAVQEAREKGYVVTLSGRRRYIPDIHASNFNIRSFAERTAINTPIQGSAADLIKIAMIKIQQRLEREGLRTKMMLQVHDELLFEVPDAELDQAKVLIKEEMEHAMDLGVKLKADVGVGANWLDAH